MKRILFLSALVCVFQWASAQGFKPRHYKTFRRLGLEINPATSYSPQSVSTLHEILKKDKQVKVNKSLGIVFSVFSATAFGFGTYMLLANKGNGSDSDVMIGSIGTIMVVSGGIYAGVAIPLLIHAKKRKKQRDRLIRSFKAID